MFYRSSFIYSFYFYFNNLFTGENLQVFTSPLYREISGIAKATQEAKAIAQEEAKLRTTAESVWTPERLNEEMKLLLQKK